MPVIKCISGVLEYNSFLTEGIESNCDIFILVILAAVTKQLLYV